MKKNKVSLLGDGYGLASLLIVVTLCLFAYTKSMALMWATLAFTMIFIARPDVLFPVMYIASLSGNVFSIESGVSISRYLSLIFVVSCFICLLKQKHHFNSNKVFIYTLIIIVTFLSITLGYDGSITFFVVMLLNLLVLFLFQEVENVDLDKLFNILCVSSLLSVALLWYFASRDNLFLMSDRFNLEGDANSNNLAMMIEQIGTMCFAYIMFGKHPILRIVSILGVLGAIALIVLTGSRSALLAMMAAMALCVIVSVRKSKHAKFLGVIIIVGLMTIVGYFFVTFLSGIDNPILERFSIQDVRESGGAGREACMKIILTKIFPEHFLFGSGMGNANMMALGKSYGLSHPSHNFIVDPLSQMGVIVYLLYLSFLLPIFKKTIILLKKGNFDYLIPVALLVAVVVNGIGEVMFYEKMFWCDLALVVIAYKQLSNSALGVNRK